MPVLTDQSALSRVPTDRRLTSPLRRASRVLQPQGEPAVPAERAGSFSEAEPEDRLRVRAAEVAPGLGEHREADLPAETAIIPAEAVAQGAGQRAQSTVYRLAGMADKTMRGSRAVLEEAEPASPVAAASTEQAEAEAGAALTAAAAREPVTKYRGLQVELRTSVPGAEAAVEEIPRTVGTQAATELAAAEAANLELPDKVLTASACSHPKTKNGELFRLAVSRFL